MISHEDILKKLLLMQFSQTGKKQVHLRVIRDYLSIICGSFGYTEYLLPQPNPQYKPKCNSKALEIVRSIYYVDVIINTIFTTILREDKTINQYAEQAVNDIRNIIIDEILTEL